MKTINEIVRNLGKITLKIIRNGKIPKDIPQACEWARQYDLPVGIYTKKDNQRDKIEIGMVFQDVRFPFSKASYPETISDEVEKMAKCLSLYQGVVVISERGVHLPESKYSITESGMN